MEAACPSTHHLLTMVTLQPITLRQPETLRLRSASTLATRSAESTYAIAATAGISSAARSQARLDQTPGCKASECYWPARRAARLSRIALHRCAEASEGSRFMECPM